MSFGECSYIREVEIPETSPGRCDGGFTLDDCKGKPFLFCEACQAPFCPTHIKVCTDCGRVYCFGSGDNECCFAEHSHVGLPVSIELELRKVEIPV